MKRIRNVLLGLLGVLVLVVAGVITYVKVEADRTFDVPKTGITASKDPEVIAHGEYLFHGPMHCSACHVGGGQNAYLAAKPGDKLNPYGGEEWKMGPIGTIRAANLTSDDATGIGKKSDEYIARVIKHGVREDGHLSPFMAVACANAADEDVRALVSYVRTLPPKQNAVAPNELGLLGQALIAFGAFAPRTNDKPAFVPASDKPTIERGRYLAHGPAMCATCHSPYNFMDNMKLEGKLFSGCYEPDSAKGDPTQEICAPNLTTHATAGRLTGWTDEVFIARMRTGAGPKETIMPWLNYANMTDTDLRSVFMYLQTIEPSDRNTGPSVRPKGWKPEASGS